jgi:superfamily II DNA/RNA helicase
MNRSKKSTNTFGGNKSNYKKRGNRNFSFSSRPSSGGNRRSPKKQRGEHIDVNKFIKKSSGVIIVPPVIKHTFKDFALNETIHNNLERKGYIAPTPIQDKSIKSIMEGKDIIGLANTGTGKTAAFLLPLIDKVEKDRNQKVLIIAPTRELVMQIEKELHDFSYGMKIFFASCVGGMNIQNQIRNLRRNPNFIIGTPGRLKDLSKRNFIKFETFNNIVLDEVDRMLDMGFVNEITEFLQHLSPQRQSLFFSATMPAKIKALVNSFLKDPITVNVQTGETADNVDQDVVRFSDKKTKLIKLEELLRNDELKKVLIFNETKRDVEKLAKDLKEKGFKAESIHGDKRQSQRQKALSLFKKDAVTILVATDVAARGLDVKDITHVINYTLPQTYDDYIHRIGRTGRGSSKGKALTFVESM